MERPFLEAQGLHKRFGPLEAVKNVHLTLRPGESTLPYDLARSWPSWGKTARAKAPR